jgi:hypothetical protein
MRCDAPDCENAFGWQWESRNPGALGLGASEVRKRRIAYVFTQRGILEGGYHTVKNLDHGRVGDYSHPIRRM